MLMKQYIKGNITEAATNSVKYFTKMLSQCSETVIFMFLGWGYQDPNSGRAAGPQLSTLSFAP